MLLRALCLFIALPLAACLVDDEIDPELDEAHATWDCYAPEPGHPTTAEKSAFVGEVVTYARDAERQHGPPAAALVAMMANESGFGFTRIGQNAHNLFGWKWTSLEAAGGRSFYTLTCQPASDPNNRYVLFSSRRDAVLFVASKLATLTRYADDTTRYAADIQAGVPVRTAVDRWVQGIQISGYNPFPSYVTTTRNFMNNVLAPGPTFSPTNNTYQYSPARRPVWISIDSPPAGAIVSGDVPLASSVGDGPVDTVRFATRAIGSATWFALATDTSAPWSANWATDPWVASGAYEIRAEAWSAGVKQATGIIQVTVDN